MRGLRLRGGVWVGDDALAWDELQMVGVRKRILEFWDLRLWIINDF
jgi:hypothetical protein